MNNWLIFLQNNGATLEASSDSSPTHVTSFGESLAEYADLQQETLLIPLTNEGVLTAQGEAAKTFLQGQLTCDVTQLTPANSLPGAQCNPKGRMLCSFQLLEQKEDTLLQLMPTELVEPTLTSLQKYAVFFKTELSNSSDNFVVLGVIGPQAEACITRQLHTAPTADNGVSSVHGVTVIKCAEQSFQVIVAADQAQEIWQKLANAAKPAGLPLWQHQMIRSGLGQVVGSTHEMFIPQMLNLQATGAVSFSKGCYTGQEVVARMKYLGKMKRWMYRLRLEGDSLPPAGSDCKLTPEGQSIGNIVAAARVAPGGMEALVVLTVEAAAAAQLLINGQPTEIQLLELPYSLEGH